MKNNQCYLVTIWNSACFQENSKAQVEQTENGWQAESHVPSWHADVVAGVSCNQRNGFILLYWLASKVCEVPCQILNKNVLWTSMAAIMAPTSSHYGRPNDCPGCYNAYCEAEFYIIKMVESWELRMFGPWPVAACSAASSAAGPAQCQNQAAGLVTRTDELWIIAASARIVNNISICKMPADEHPPAAALPGQLCSQWILLYLCIL